MTSELPTRPAFRFVARYRSRRGSLGNRARACIMEVSLVVGQFLKLTHYRLVSALPRADPSPYPLPQGEGEFFFCGLGCESERGSAAGLRGSRAAA